MVLRIITLGTTILALSMPCNSGADTGPPSAQAAAEGNAGQVQYERLSSELLQRESGLPAKKAELARLHRKWVVAKGRMPTAKELKKFEEKMAKGQVKSEDNPFVNKNPLSTPGRYRVAYFQKLDEIKADEERIATLRHEIRALGRSIPSSGANLE